MPLVRQLLTHLDGAHALVYPAVAVALATIVLDGHLKGQFWVNHLVNAHTAQLGKPLFHRFGFLGGYGLDDSENTFEVSGLGLSFLSIWSQHYNRGTNCTPLGVEFRITCPHSLDVLLDISAVSQDLHYIRYREIVLLLFCIPYDANFLALKELYSDTILCEFGCKVTKYSSRRF